MSCLKCGWKRYNEPSTATVTSFKPTLCITTTAAEHTHTHTHTHTDRVTVNQTPTIPIIHCSSVEDSRQPCVAQKQKVIESFNSWTPNSKLNVAQLSWRSKVWGQNIQNGLRDEQQRVKQFLHFKTHILADICRQTLLSSDEVTCSGQVGSTLWHLPTDVLYVSTVVKRYVIQTEFL